MRRDWWVPLLGVLFVIVTIVSFAVGGEPPGADEGAREVQKHYVDNDSAVMIGAALASVAAGLFVFFAAYLRSVLRRVEGEGGMLSALVLIGASIFATGIAIDATISFALAEQADEISPDAIQALQALWDNDFMPLALGLAVFLLSTGLSVIIHGGLPKWLGWIAILLGIVAFTPIGFFAFPVAGLWVLAVSVMLTMRNRRPGTA